MKQSILTLLGLIIFSTTVLGQSTYERFKDLFKNIFMLSR